MRVSFVVVAAVLGLFLAAPLLDAQPPDRARASLGITIDMTRRGPDQRGVVVSDIAPDGPAAKAGIRSGDVILKVEGKDVNDFDAVANAVANHKPGDKLDVEVRREGKDQKLSVTLGERPLLPRPAVERSAAYLGVQSLRLTPELKRQWNATVDTGTLLTEIAPNSPASRGGLKRGDVVTRLDSKNIASPDDLREAVQAAGAGKEVTLQLQRGGDKKEFKVRLEEAPSDFRFGRPVPFPGVRPPSGGLPSFGVENQRIQQLERQVEQLEKRVRELEKKVTTPGKEEPKEGGK
jgi:S1-C subfamily serine protease